MTPSITPPSDATLPHLAHAAWTRWQIIARINGDAIARATVFIFYFTIFALFAILARLFADPLKLKTPIGWLPRKPVSADLEDARAQS